MKQAHVFFSINSLVTLFTLISMLLFPGVLPAQKMDFNIHGYISQGFMISNHNNFLADTKNGTFQFNELGINFATEPTDNLRIGLQLIARDLGDIGNDKVLIDWAYADYRWRDWLGMRLGKIKMPTGIYNKTIDVDMLRTFIFLPQGNYTETFRDSLNAMKGIGGYGVTRIPHLGSLSYEAMYGTMNIDNDSSTAKGMEGPGYFEVEKVDVKRTFCCAITWETPIEGLKLSASRVDIKLKLQSMTTKDFTVPVPFPPYKIVIAPAGTPMNSEIPNLNKTIFSIEYTWKNLVLAAEYAMQNFAQTTRLPDQKTVSREFKFAGFYGSATYRFSDLLETGIYYTEFYKDRDDRDGTRTPYNPPFSAYQKDACLALRFDPNPQWTFKIEGHMINGTALCFVQDNLNDAGELTLQKKWYLLAAKMTFSF